MASSNCIGGILGRRELRFTLLSSSSWDLNTKVGISGSPGIRPLATSLVSVRRNMRYGFSLTVPIGASAGQNLSCNLAVGCKFHSVSDGFDDKMI